MKNTCWFFGDSFTESAAIDHDLYVKFLGGKRYKIWSEQLSEYLNCKTKNFSKGGMAPQTIIDTFIEQMSNFKENDYVFISTSPYIRTIGYVETLDKITTWNSEPYYLYHHKDRKEALEESDTKIFGVPFTDDVRTKLLVDYLYYFITPYENKWKEYFEEKIKNFIKLFNKQNIKVYYWDYYLWQTNSFSNLRDETNGQFNDDHWGVEGEKQFLKYMIRRIEDNKQFHNVKPPYNAYKGKYNPQSLI